MTARIGIACLALAIGTVAVRADSLGDCRQNRTPALRLRACSTVIAEPTYSPDDKALAYRYRGSARADAGAGTQAIADFSEAIRLQPNEAAGFAGRAAARVAIRDLNGAIADYTDALRLTPGVASLHVGRGHAHFVSGDATAAIADFTEAIRLNPNSPSTFNRRGLAHRRSGNLAQAIDDYSAAISINPVYALAYNNRGYVYEAQGRKADAIADFQAALLLDPSLIGARDGLKRLGFTGSLLAASEARVKAGQALVEQNCSGCHAVGSAGASPNKNAPAFRSLHARHGDLALREPLTRGIAAPHDEMPKFALSGPEIDTIVAYINSLSAVRPSQPRAKASDPIGDTVDIGDSRKGRAFAQRACASCHSVGATDAASPNRQAPSFAKIANTPGMTVTALTVWSRTTHKTMPNLIIPPADMDDLIAYVISLRNQR